jgi:hypothetical protein
MKPAVRCAVFLVSLLALAASAQAQLQPWDQAKVTELAKQLETSTNDLYQAFRRQPQPTLGSAQRKPYFRLRHEVRQLRREARSLSNALQGGAGLDETQPSFESLMSTVRITQDRARRVFTVADMHAAADKSREVLNQLAPYFEEAPTPLEAPARR